MMSVFIINIVSFIFGGATVIFIHWLNENWGPEKKDDSPEIALNKIKSTLLKHSSMLESMERFLGQVSFKQSNISAPSAVSLDSLKKMDELEKHVNAAFSQSFSAMNLSAVARTEAAKARVDAAEVKQNAKDLSASARHMKNLIEKFCEATTDSPPPKAKKRKR